MVNSWGAAWARTISRTSIGLFIVAAWLAAEAEAILFKRLTHVDTSNATILASQSFQDRRSLGNTSIIGNARGASGVEQPPSAVVPRPPRVYFLFLAVDKVSNLNVWQSFFAQAPVDEYRAFVHCKDPACVASVSGSALVPVPTVPSYYCTDLVSPMNQLLATALASDGQVSNRNDKFAFVSDSTLPAKPFWHIYSTLTARPGSDFCVFPSKEWADIPGAAGMDLAVKHHQWVTLARDHAERASQLWSAGTLHDFMTRYQMNTQQYSTYDNTFGDNRNFGCLDEFWYMATLYGPLAHAGVAVHQSVLLPLYTGPPLVIGDTSEWQGACDTFVLWSQYMRPQGSSPFDRFYASLDAPSVPHGGNYARPGWWDAISSHGISAIRNSDFLFVRKFVDGPWLTDARPMSGGFAEAYARLVFGR